jgi:hypothetical protein
MDSCIQVSNAKSVLSLWPFLVEPDNKCCLLGMQAGGLAPKAPLNVNTRTKLCLGSRSYRPNDSHRRPTSIIGFSQPPSVPTHG